MSKENKPKAYAQAGVDIALADRLLNRVKPELRKATRPEVLGGIGSFGGLFDISKLSSRHKHPVLVSSTDSVGTKLKVASLAGKHDGVGHDIVNHCMNDIAVMGAEPLFFLDYFACDKLDAAVYPAVLKSVARACRAGGCALVGGETCELPGVYLPGEYDLVGTVVGCVDRASIITGEAIRPGDVVLGVDSDGLHTNGFSLARKIVFGNLGMAPGDRFPGGRGGIANALLKPHRNYAGLLSRLISSGNRGKRGNTRAHNQILGIAHITGGGLTGNLPRVLPEGTAAEINTDSWDTPPLFRFLVEQGKVDYEESHEVWNMGIGLALVVPPNAAEEVMANCKSAGHHATAIGAITRGNGKVKLVRD